MINLNKGIFGLFVIFSLCFSGITFAAEPLSIATAVKKALEYSLTMRADHFPGPKSF